MTGIRDRAPVERVRRGQRHAVSLSRRFLEKHAVGVQIACLYGFGMRQDGNLVVPPLDAEIVPEQPAAESAGITAEFPGQIADRDVSVI